MLSLRMIIVAGIAGICFWGLFQLLDNLREPGLLRTTRAVAVKGCASLDDHQDGARLCPQFLCQKALIDRKLAPLDAQFAMDDTEVRDDLRTVRGVIISSAEPFECTVSGVKVNDARLTSTQPAAAFR